MYEVKADVIQVGGLKMVMYTGEITDHNVLGVSAGTTGHCAGGERRDCLTRISIKDRGGTDIRVKPTYPEDGPFRGEADGVEITLVGDSELDTIIDGLAIILQALKDGRGKLECQQRRY